MEGFFRQLQSVVDIEDDEEATNNTIEAEMDDLPNNVVELKGRLINALGRVKTASERWEKLHSESCAIESELAALRLRYKTSRDHWLLVHEFDQNTIDALLEERLTARAGDPDAPDAIFVASLRKQNETLRELIRKHGEDRDRATLQAQQQQQQQPMASAEPAADFAALEAALQRQAESLSALARERREVSSYTDVQRIAQLERELDAMRLAMGRAGEAPQPEQQEQQQQQQQAATATTTTAIATATAAEASQLEENTDTRAAQREQELAAALEENAAREEALHALYSDVQLLRERNAELDAQLSAAEDNAALLAQEAAAAREECLAALQSANESRDTAERLQREQQRIGRELAAAGEELRRARRQAAVRPERPEPLPLKSVPPPPLGPSAMTTAAHPTAAAAATQALIGEKARDTLREWAHVIGRPRRALVAAAVVIALFTLIFALVGGSASDHEIVALRLQEELRLCRLKLQAGAAAAQRV